MESANVGMTWVSRLSSLRWLEEMFALLSISSLYQMTFLAKRGACLCTLLTGDRLPDDPNSSGIVRKCDLDQRPLLRNKSMLEQTAEELTAPPPGWNVLELM